MRVGLGLRLWSLGEAVSTLASQAGQLKTCQHAYFVSESAKVWSAMERPAGMF